MVKAVLRPLSSLMLQLLYGSHTVPNSARPAKHRVSRIADMLAIVDKHGAIILKNNLCANYLKCHTCLSLDRCPAWRNIWVTVIHSINTPELFHTVRYN